MFMCMNSYVALGFTSFFFSCYEYLHDGMGWVWDGAVWCGMDYYRFCWSGCRVYLLLLPTVWMSGVVVVVMLFAFIIGLLLCTRDLLIVNICFPMRGVS
ncbi:hypothetical protein ASPFODRAFT_681381 [Aspergillus luchuensis CBS 106.47]|uniref:Uncharacterized protein n=1 Tax=Aspergillus luchuensis (strain CBS 106.47) TaxID=1137211 RepID=A0A1M3TCJ4_ASPLC|nr:hypothetical protein ASPFODRAFT_681381 [Aspergillus luchuensis CBS 106.47]